MKLSEEQLSFETKVCIYPFAMQDIKTQLHSWLNIFTQIFMTLLKMAHHSSMLKRHHNPTARFSCSDIVILGWSAAFPQLLSCWIQRLCCDYPHKTLLPEWAPLFSVSWLKYVAIWAWFCNFKFLNFRILANKIWWSHVLITWYDCVG